MGQAASPAHHRRCCLRRSVCEAGEWGPAGTPSGGPQRVKSIWLSICSGSPSCLPLPCCWSLRLSDTSSKHWVCSRPGPHPLCSTHLGQPMQGKGEPNTNGHARGVTCAQTEKGGRQRRDHDTTHELHLYRWALCVSKTGRLRGALQGTAPGRGQMGDGSCA